MGGLAKIGEWCASVARAGAIATIAMLSVVAYAAGSLRRLAIRDPIARQHHRARQRGRLLRWAFASLGATFIKVGQVMSTRPDLFSPEIIDELRSLQDRVPPFRYRHVRRIIERELGAPVEQRFRALSPTPVAAGSVAQVHRGVLDSGEEVAVKVLRPGVIAQTRRDGRLLLWLAHLSHAISSRARTADVVGHARNLVTGIFAQTDLRLEHNNYERFRRNFAGTSGLHFPHVHASHSTRSMLTMEFVHGRRLDDVVATRLPAAARVLRNAFFAMCFEHGLVRADLHPGNVLIRADGVVTLLDVGLVKRLPRGLLVQVVDFARCLAAGDASDLVRHLRRYHRYLATTDWAAVTADATAFLDRVRSRSIMELGLAAVVTDLFALARKHAIRPMPEMTLVLLGMVTNEGMARRLDPEVDVMSVLARYLGACKAPAPDLRRLARGTRKWSRSLTDAIVPHPAPVAGHGESRVVIGRPPRLRPARITARYLAAARAAATKDR